MRTTASINSMWYLYESLSGLVNDSYRRDMYTNYMNNMTDD